jgi:hypothetical protein
LQSTQRSRSRVCDGKNEDSRPEPEEESAARADTIGGCGRLKKCVAQNAAIATDGHTMGGASVRIVFIVRHRITDTADQKQAFASS